jgi:hypothetical protein
MNKETTIEFQMCYSFFDENSHSMNAIIFNDCERQFIDAIQSLNKYLDFIIEIEVLAKEDGSLKGVYRAIVKNPIVLILITAAATSFFTSSFPRAIHQTEETKNKLENILTIKEAIKLENLTVDEFDYVAENDKDLKKLRSNFFKNAKKEEKIKQIEIKSNTQIDGCPVFESKIVTHNQFDQFIIRDEFETEEDMIDAKIYIVAPILIKGRRDFWKGILNDEFIEFRVTDKNFLDNVYNHTVKFSNGTYINCKLKTVKTINLMTCKETLTRDVIEVINYGDNENYVKPIRKRTIKIHDPGQMLLLFDD